MPGDDQVDVLLGVQVPDRGGEHPRGADGVGAGDRVVEHVDRVLGAHLQATADGVDGVVGAHGQGVDGPARPASTSASAASRAFSSSSFRVPSPPSRTTRPSGPRARSDWMSGTCFTQTTILTRGTLPPAPDPTSTRSQGRRHPTRVRLVPPQCPGDPALPPPASRHASVSTSPTRAWTSPSTPRTPRVSTCACSTATTRRRVPLDRVRARRVQRAPSPASAPASGTASARTGRGSPRPGTGTTPPSCWSTRTRAGSTATSRTRRRRTATSSAPTWRATRTVPRTRATPPVTSRTRSSSTPATCPARTRPPTGPWTPWSRTVVYEAHVRGLTHAGRPAARRSCAAPTPASRTPRSIDHLLGLGVTAIELLPVHAFSSEPHLVEKGLTNYWGYSTLGFFAPHAAYATAAAQAAGPGGRARRAARRGPRAARGRPRGAARRRLQPHVRGRAAAASTCPGAASTTPPTTRTTAASPAALADVTGTRQHARLPPRRGGPDDPGLAALLGRRRRGRRVPLRPGGDPRPRRRTASPRTTRCSSRWRPTRSLHGLKLVAEPWDVGPGGWRTGQFPRAVRRVERPVPQRGPLVLARRPRPRRARPARPPRARPGHAAGRVGRPVRAQRPAAGPRARSRRSTTSPPTTASRSPTWWPTTTSTTRPTASTTATAPTTTGRGTTGSRATSGRDSPAVDIVPLRRRSIRNLFATLVLAAGTPMITAGDEMGRTQQGNNNAYCQDNEISWVRWDLTPWRADLLATARWLLPLRREHPALRSERFYSGRPVRAGPPAGPRLVRRARRRRSTTTAGTTRRSARCRWCAPPRRPSDDTVLLVINGSLDAVHLVLADDHGGRWRLAWDSVWEHPAEERAAAIEGSLHAEPGRGDRRGAAEHAGVRAGLRSQRLPGGADHRVSCPAPRTRDVPVQAVRVAGEEHPAEVGAGTVVDHRRDDPAPQTDTAVLRDDEHVGQVGEADAVRHRPARTRPGHRTPPS